MELIRTKTDFDLAHRPSKVKVFIVDTQKRAHESSDYTQELAYRRSKALVFLVDTQKPAHESSDYTQELAYGRPGRLARNLSAQLLLYI